MKFWTVGPSGIGFYEERTATWRIFFAALFSKKMSRPRLTRFDGKFSLEFYSDGMFRCLFKFA